VKGEIKASATIRNFRIVRPEGSRDVGREIERYSKQVFLKDWEIKLNDFLRFNDRQVLGDKGRVSKMTADARAEAEYAEFAAQRRALLEAEGERDHERSLEDAVPRLPERPKRRQ